VPVRGVRCGAVVWWYTSNEMSGLHMFCAHFAPGPVEHCITLQHCIALHRNIIV
jgi:hypothetical protein